MGTPTVNSQTLLRADITEQSAGAWHAGVDLEGEAALTGSVTITIDDVEWFGTVVQSRAENQFVRALVVGGAGGLSRELAVRDYGPTTVGTLLADWARETGESFQAASLAAIASRAVLSWHREAGRASDALQAIVEPLGVTWRVLRDGSIMVGMPTWAATTATPTELDADAARGVFLLADAAGLEPGTTYQGERIAEVEHRLEGGRLRTTASVQSANGILERLFARIERRIDRACAWGAALAKPTSGIHAEGLPDNARMKGQGLTKAQLIFGLPGWTAVIPKDARGLVLFDGASPERPRWVGYEYGCPVTQLAFDGGTKAIARVDDTVDAGEIYMQVTAAVPPVYTLFYRAPGLAEVWTPVVTGPIPPVAPGIGTPIEGVITSGCVKLLA